MGRLSVSCHVAVFLFQVQIVRDFLLFYGKFPIGIEPNSLLCRLYHGDPVMNPLTPWERPPLKNIFCIYGVDSRTEVLIKMLCLKIESLKHRMQSHILFSIRLVTILHQVANLTLTTGLLLMLYMSWKDLYIPGNYFLPLGSLDYHVWHFKLISFGIWELNGKF